MSGHPGRCPGLACFSPRADEYRNGANMARTLSSQTIRRFSQGLIGAALGAATLSCTGCSLPSVAGGNPALPSPVARNAAPATDGGHVVQASHVPVEIVQFPKGTPIGQPRECCSYWDKELQMASDPTRHGDRVPCLVGRLILMDAENKPVC